MTPRADQLRAIADARAALSSGRTRILIVGPTGFGKSVIAAEIARAHLSLSPDTRVLALAHRRELVSQLAGKLRLAGLQTGEIHPGATAFPARAQVASIDTLLARDQRPPATLVIWDEAHHAMAPEWAKLHQSYPDAILIGLTATPALADGSGLGAVFDALVVAATPRELMDSGVLVPCEVISPDKSLGPGELAQDPVDAYIAHGNAEQAILFAPSVKLAVEYASAFRARGIESYAIWGEMPDHSRLDHLARFRDTRTTVLPSVATLTEGFDHPPASICILARRVGHAGLYLQMVGRVLRAASQKTRAVLIDLVGATHVHGPPDEERLYSLEGRGLRRAVDDIDVRFCPVCGSIVTTDTCEECGHSGEMRQRKPRVLGLPMQRFAKQRRQPDDERAATLLRWLSSGRAKNFGHARHIYNAVYGEMPSSSVLSILRSLQRGAA